MHGRRHNLSIVTIIVVPLFFACSAPPTQPLEDNTDWQDIAQLPSGRADFGVAVFRDHVYVVGGWADDFAATQSVYRYDADADAWDRLADFPHAIADLALVVSRDTLFALGGTRAITEHPTRMLRAYDPETDTWSDRASIPDERAGHATVEVDGSIYLLGGPVKELPDEHGPRIPGDSVLVYDVLTGAWSYRDPMQKPTYGIRGVFDTGLIHTFGGSSAITGLPDDSIRSYDPVTDDWVAVGYDPNSAFSPSIALLHDDVHVIGSRVDGTSHRSFNLTDRTWSFRGRMWAPLSGTGAVVYRGELYVIGGRFGRQSITRALVYRPA